MPKRARSEGADLCISVVKQHQGNLGLLFHVTGVCTCSPCCLQRPRAALQLGPDKVFNISLLLNLFPKPKCCQTRTHLTLNEIGYTYSALLVLLLFLKNLLYVASEHRSQETFSNLLCEMKLDYISRISMSMSYYPGLFLSCEALSGLQRNIQ